MVLKIIGYTFIGFSLVLFIYATVINGLTDKTARYDNVWGGIIAGCLMVMASPE